MNQSNLVTIDLALVQQQVQEAERRYQAAVEERDRVVAEQDFLVDEANMDLRQAKMTLAFVQEAAVGRGVANSGQAADAKDDSPVEAESDELRTTPTKEAVLRVLHDSPGRVFSLRDLHREMQRRGYQGTHNAVHVAVSRQVKEGAPIRKAHKGHYQLADQEALTLD